MKIRERGTVCSVLSLALALVAAPTVAARAQAAAPDAPNAQSAPQTAAPGAPAQLQPMPPPDPANFTAATPTKETVNDFLRASWGYDDNRIYQVQAIQKTAVQGISRVTVLVEEKGSQQTQPSALVFLTLPDGQHLVANDDIMPFGARPFASYNDILRRDAKGPSVGPAAAPLQLVEFADFQCPHCKEAQPIIQHLMKDYPQAHIVSELFPLRNIHSEAEKSAEAGVCVAKIGGNEAFFKYSDAIYANQAALTPESSAQAIAGAITASGVDATKVKSCQGQPATKAAIDDSLALGETVGVSSTPTLFVNGRGLPGFGSIPYETLKKIIDYDLAGSSAK